MFDLFQLMSDSTLWTLDQIQLALSIVAYALMDLQGVELDITVLDKINTVISNINLKHPIQLMLNHEYVTLNGVNTLFEKLTLNFPYSILLNPDSIYKVLIYRIVDIMPTKGYKTVTSPAYSSVENGDYVHTLPLQSKSELWIVQNHPNLNHKQIMIEDSWTLQNILAL